MADIKTQSIMPKGDENGLIDLAPTLAAEAAGPVGGKQLRPALVLFQALRVTIEDEVETVTVAIRRIEPVLPQDYADCEKFIRRALEARSGEEVLPLELEDDIRKAFGEMAEPNSGQDPDKPDDPGNAPPDRKGT